MSFGPAHLYQEVDVADAARVEAAAAHSIRQCDAVHVLANNAGITGPNHALTEYPLDDWRRVFEVSTHATFVACKRLAVHMRQHRLAGRIINVASVAGKEGNPNARAYSASKAAVIALTKSLRKELADTEIRVNCVTPGAVQTPLFAQMSP